MIFEEDDELRRERKNQEIKNSIIQVFICWIPIISILGYSFYEMNYVTLFNAIFTLGWLNLQLEGYYVMIPKNIKNSESNLLKPQISIIKYRIKIKIIFVLLFFNLLNFLGKIIYTALIFTNAINDQTNFLENYDIYLFSKINDSGEVPWKAIIHTIVPSFTTFLLLLVSFFTYTNYCNLSLNVEKIKNVKYSLFFNVLKPFTFILLLGLPFFSFSILGMIFFFIILFYLYVSTIIESKSFRIYFYQIFKYFIFFIIIFEFLNGIPQIQGIITNNTYYNFYGIVILKDLAKSYKVFFFINLFFILIL